MEEKTQRMTKAWKSDNRPKKGLWLPGSYCGICRVCGEPYIGDKRSVSCADCAYSGNEKLRQPSRDEGDDAW